MLTFSELSSDEFATFAKTLPMNNFLQSAEMFSRYRAIGKEAYLVGLRSGLEVKLAALLVCIYKGKGQKIFSAPGGPLLDYFSPDTQSLLATFVAKARPFLKQESASILQISPNIFMTTR